MKEITLPITSETFTKIFILTWVTLTIWPWIHMILGLSVPEPPLNHVMVFLGIGGIFISLISYTIACFSFNWNVFGVEHFIDSIHFKEKTTNQENCD